MKVLIACECSGKVREAFRRRGHDAWSCDTKPAEDNSPFHIIGDCFEVAASQHWDLIIWHPPCTDLSVSGNAHAAAKIADGRRQLAVDFFMRCVRFPVDRWCVENPIGVMSTIFRQPDQTIQPHHFGEDASKATCFWLWGLAPLMRTHMDGDLFLPAPPAPRMVNGRPRYANQTDSGQNKLYPGPSRAADRARTYDGIAEAMAEQWGNQ